MSKKKKRKPADADADAIADAPAFGAPWEPAEVADPTSPDLYDLAAGRQSVASPLASVEYTGNAEVDSAAEMQALKSAFAQRAAQEAARRVAATDSEYWCCLCFQSREQKEAFLAFMGWLGLGDKYLDGFELARRQGVALPSNENLRFVPARPDKAWTEMALPLDEDEGESR